MAQPPSWAVVIREGKDGTPFYDVMWWSRAEPGVQKKRRLGKAWVRKSNAGEWGKRPGRTPEGYLDPRTAPAAAEARVTAVEAELLAAARASQDEALSFRRLAKE